MEIEFNPSQVPVTTAPKLTRLKSAPTRAAAEMLDTAGALKTKLNALPLRRPDQVSQAKARVAGSQYPPPDLMERIASLLASRLG